MTTSYKILTGLLHVNKCNKCYIDMSFRPNQPCVWCDGTGCKNIDTLIDKLIATHSGALIRIQNG